MGLNENIELVYIFVNMTFRTIAVWSQAKALSQADGVVAALQTG